MLFFFLKLKNKTKDIIITQMIIVINTNNTMSIQFNDVFSVL